MGFVDPRQSNSSNSNFGQESDFLVGGWAPSGPYQGAAGSNYSDRLLIPKDPSMANQDEGMKSFIRNQRGYTQGRGIGQLYGLSSRATKGRELGNKSLGQLSFGEVGQLSSGGGAVGTGEFTQSPRLRSLAEGRVRAGLSPREVRGKWGRIEGTTAERDQWGHKTGPGS
jgi:hypothetical protein